MPPRRGPDFLIRLTGDGLNESPTQRGEKIVICGEFSACLALKSIMD
jgi:hypothetical protein